MLSLLLCDLSSLLNQVKRKADWELRVWVSMTPSTVAAVVNSEGGKTEDMQDKPSRCWECTASLAGVQSGSVGVSPVDSLASVHAH